MRARLVFTTLLAATVSFTAASAVDCPGDINGDGVVDVNDFLQLLGEWGCTDCASDINGDGIVDVSDFLELLADWGCEVGSVEPGTLSGNVTNLWTTDPIVGATVTVGADVLVTDEFGDYTGDIAPGTYDVVFDAEYFTSQTVMIELVEGVPMILDAQMEPVAAVIVNVVVNDTGEPGGLVDAIADVVVLDGSTIQTYAWEQTEGTPAVINGADTDTATLTLGTQYEYKEELMHVMSEPPIGPDQLPPNVPLPPDPFPGGLQNRFEVTAPNPFVLEETGLVGLMVDVTTTTGTYEGHGEVHTHIPWKPAGGIRNVPINIPVLMHGKDQASYDWAMTVPSSSNAVLIDETTQYPEFTPDWPGLYEVTVTDLGAAATVTLQIYAGNWRGVIVGEEADGRPVPD
ncbi:MAG: carboxypeptidase regulatory-like domain-containing protein, partial [Planctomycetota bacterium]